jgi:hypothetical protein
MTPSIMKDAGYFILARFGKTRRRTRHQRQRQDNKDIDIDIAIDI